MNKIRRTKIKEQIEAMEIIKSSIEDILDEEQDAFDNMPESLQYSERGETSQEAIDSMENVLSSLEDILEELEAIA